MKFDSDVLWSANLVLEDPAIGVLVGWLVRLTLARIVRSHPESALWYVKTRDYHWKPLFRDRAFQSVSARTPCSIEWAELRKVVLGDA